MSNFQVAFTSSLIGTLISVVPRLQDGESVGVCLLAVAVTLPAGTLVALAVMKTLDWFIER